VRSQRITSITRPFALAAGAIAIVITLVTPVNEPDHAYAAKVTLNHREQTQMVTTPRRPNAGTSARATANRRLRDFLPVNVRQWWT